MLINACSLRSGPNRETAMSTSSSGLPLEPFNSLLSALDCILPTLIVKADAGGGGEGTKGKNSSASHGDATAARGRMTTDTDVLRRLLTPVTDELDAIDIWTVLPFGKAEEEKANDPHAGPSSLPILSMIKPSPDFPHTTTRHLEVVSDRIATSASTGSSMSYDVSVFVLPPMAKIPLHDHPSMCVLTKILLGDLTAKRYNIRERETDQDNCDVDGERQREDDEGAGEFFFLHLKSSQVKSSQVKSV